MTTRFMLALLSGVALVMALSAAPARADDDNAAAVTIKPTADNRAAGATIKINGKTVGTVPLKVTLQPGRYLVEVEKPDHTSFHQWIDVKAKDVRDIEVKLDALGPKGGTLLVAANIVGAKVLVDGKEVDTSPALVKAVTPGKHTVEAQAPGYKPSKVVVLVELGKTRKVTLTLEPDAATVAKTSGTIQVIATAKEVAVIVDGKLAGQAPLRVTGLEEGSHVIEGTLAGYTSAKQTVEVKKGELKTIKLELKRIPPKPREGDIKVTSSELGALVFVDGKLQGKTPFRRRGYVPGPHVVTIRKDGFREHVESVEVKAGGVAAIDIKLEAENKPQDPSKLVTKKAKVRDHGQRLRGLASYSARGMEPLLFTVDASSGFPYLFEARVGLGMVQKSIFRLDGGLGFRTFGAMSEVGMRMKARFARYELFSAAATFGLGGGGGTKGRNTFYTDLGVAGSLTWRNFIHVTVRAYFNIYTDRLCPAKVRGDELAACSTPPSGVNAATIRQRFVGARFFMSAIVELAITKHFGLFGIFEGVPFQPDRRALTDAFASVMPTSDPGTYFRFGVTLKN